MASSPVNTKHIPTIIWCQDLWQKIDILSQKQYGIRHGVFVATETTPYMKTMVTQQQQSSQELTQEYISTFLE